MSDDEPFHSRERIDPKSGKGTRHRDISSFGRDSGVTRYISCAYLSRCISLRIFGPAAGSACVKAGAESIHPYVSQGAPRGKNKEAQLARAVRARPCTHERGNRRAC